VPHITWPFVVCISVRRPRRRHHHHHHRHHRASLCNSPAALKTTQSRFTKCGLTSCPQTDIDVLISTDSFTFHQLLSRAAYCQFFTILGVGKLVINHTIKHVTAKKILIVNFFDKGHLTKETKWTTVVLLANNNHLFIQRLSTFYGV